MKKLLGAFLLVISCYIEIRSSEEDCLACQYDKFLQLRAAIKRLHRNVYKDFCEFNKVLSETPDAAVNLPIDVDGNTALHKAVGFINKHGTIGEIMHERSYNKDNIIALLQDVRVNPNLCNAKGVAPFSLANKHDDSVVEAFLSCPRFNVFMRDSNNDTVLHSVVRSDCSDQVVFKLLTDVRLDSNSQNDNGDTPLHYAALRRSVAILKALLERGADARLKNIKGESVLHFAAQNLHSRQQIIPFLLQRGFIDLNLKDSKGRTPFHVAADMGKNIKAFLKASGVDFNARDNNGNTVLHCAMQVCRERVIFKLLHDPRIDRNIKNNEGRTPLHCALYNLDKPDFGMGIPRFGTAKILLSDLLVNPNIPDDNGNTPLHIVCKKFGVVTGAQMLISILLKRGANINAVNLDNKYPEDLVAPEFRLEVNRLFHGIPFICDWVVSGPH